MIYVSILICVNASTRLLIPSEKGAWKWSRILICLSSPPADIDDMHICYVLRDGDNATSDVFYFSIEDIGRSLQVC